MKLEVIWKLAPYGPALKVLKDNIQAVRSEGIGDFTLKVNPTIYNANLSSKNKQTKKIQPVQ